MPNPPSDGGAQAMHNTTLGLLKNKVDVDVLAINPSRNFIDIGTLDKDYLESTNFQGVYVDTKLKPIQILLNFFKSESYFIERFRSKDFENKLIEILNSKEYDIVQLEHLYVLLYLDTIRKHSDAKIIFRPQNIEYIIWERYLQNLKNPLKRVFISVATKRLKKFEQEYSRKVDGIIALTENDAEVFRTFKGDCPVIDIPMGFYFDHLTNYDFDLQYQKEPEFYHLGSMDWLPNEEAIDWFFQDILDLVKQKTPSAKIHIAGRNMQKKFYQYSNGNVVVEGEIKSPVEYQQDKSVMIVPLISGSGIRAKIVEGLALGKTIITTTIGAQGIKYIEGENLLIADTKEEFSDKIQECFNSVEFCKRIGQNARILASEKYDYNKVAAEMIQFYSNLTKNEI